MRWGALRTGEGGEDVLGLVVALDGRGVLVVLLQARLDNLWLVVLALRQRLACPSQDDARRGKARAKQRRQATAR